MISIDPHDIATRIAVSVEIENFACYYCVIPVLLWYDYFLTLSDEVKYIWNARLSVSSILFYVIRYSALLSSICEVIATRKWLRQSEMVSKSCIMIESWVMGSIIVLYTAAAGFSAMRVYALYQRHMALALLTLVLALGNPAIYLYVYSQTAPLAITSMTAISCGIWFTQDPNFYYEKWLLGARACSIAADAIVVALTWCKTMQAMGKNFKRHRMPLMTVMVSDGTMCFLVLLILNILSLSVWHDVFYSNPMTMWISVFTPILTTRFMLDLRQAAQPGDETGMSQLTTIHFGQCPRGTCEGQCPDAVQHGHNEVEDPDDDSAYWDEDWQGGSECASIVQS